MYTHMAAETYNVYHSPSHRWYYLDGMRPSETHVFKSYDSRKTESMARGKFPSREEGTLSLTLL